MDLVEWNEPDHLLKVRPNSLEDPVKWNKASPNIREVKGIFTNCSHKVGNKLHGAKSYPRKRIWIIHVCLQLTL